jgi:N-acetylmuramoyl-L-alanine amidase CwlA
MGEDMSWKGIVGVSYQPDEFDSYCHALSWPKWRPNFIVLHNTAVPSLAQRPAGLTKKHIENLEAYYQGKGWKAGPHLFIDDKQIWAFTPLNVSGVHSPSWNKVALGVEMLGDYEKEEFGSTRGLKVQKNTVAAFATLHAVLGLDPDTIRLHYEDPATTHKCPGKKVVKGKFIQAVKDLIAERHDGEHLA